MDFTKKLKRTVLSSAVILGMAGIPALAQMNDQSASNQSRSNGQFSSTHSKSNIRQVQQELKQQGFYKGRVDGIEGPQTRAAIKKYQEQNKLTASGRLDEQTLQSLGVSGTGMRGEAARSVGNTGRMQSTSEIKQVQSQLKQQGFYTGAVDGISGPETHSAIKKFQQQKNLRVTGRLDQQTLQALGIGGTASNVQPGMQGTQGEASRSEMGTSGQFSPGVIKEAQSALQSQGLYNGPVNGVQDQQTQAAISQFQQQNGLAVTGNLDPETLQSLGISGTESQGQASRSMEEPGPAQTGQSEQNQSQYGQPEANESGQASRSEEQSGQAQPGQAAAPQALAQSTVSAAQQALKDKGFYAGPVNGVMDQATRTAITNYQQQNNLPANGLLTQQTAQSLGIAGSNSGQTFESAGGQ